MNVDFRKPLLGFIVFLVTISILYSAASTTLFCQTNKVNVRAEPSTDSKILSRLSTNDSIMPVEENDERYKIDYQNEEAWVFKSFFDKKKVETKKYWYNSKSGVLHNSNCKWYGNTKKGYFTDKAIGRDCSYCGGAMRNKPEIGYKYWINTNSGVRHNRGCRWYGNTKQGYFTNEKVGRPCGLCGG